MVGGGGGGGGGGDMKRLNLTRVKIRVIRLQVIEGRNTSGQIAFCVFQSFSVEVQTNAGYMRRMRNYNLEIRITDSSCRPQLRIPRLQDFIFPTYGRYIPLISRVFGP